MPTSKRLNALGSGVFARSDAAKQAYREKASQQGGPALIDLSIGSSDQVPPVEVLESMASAVLHPSSTSYCLQAGVRPFHQAAADWCRQRFGVAVDPDREVQLLVGSQEGTAHLPLAVLDPGDAALHLDPCYPSHSGGLHLAGAAVQKLSLSAEQGWRPDLQSLRVSQLDQLKLFVFGYPHNPTGRVGDQEDLNQIMALGNRHQLVIAHDNPYVDLALDGAAPSLLQTGGWRDWGIEFFSLSKGWCLGGFRLGFAVGAAPLISALRQTKAVIDFNQSLALQQGESWPCESLPIGLASCIRFFGSVVIGLCVCSPSGVGTWPFQRWRCTSGCPCLQRPLPVVGRMNKRRRNCCSAVVLPSRQALGLGTVGAIGCEWPWFDRLLNSNWRPSD